MSFQIDEGTGKTIFSDVFGTPTSPSSNNQIQCVALLAGASGAQDHATGANPVPVRTGVVELISVTLTLDTSAYANGDLIADAQAITGAVRISGGSGELVSLMVIDEDDQKAAIDIYVTQVNTTWGSENSAPSLSDAGGRSIQAVIPIATGDYKDLGGVSVANIKNIGAVVKASGSADLYVAVVNGSGTPTYTASGVRLVFGFKQN